LLTAVALLSGFLVAGCGASAPGPSTGPATTGAPTTATGAGATSAAAGASAGTPNALAFSMCMRANGVTSFPDPQPGGGFLFHASAPVTRSPAFKAAQAKCQKLLPGGGFPTPGSTTHPSAQTLAQLLAIAQCMHQRGIPEFPDPRTSVPSNPFGSGYGVITDYKGAILLFPSTLDMQSPAYTRAAVAYRAAFLARPH
jgi:hypothetical protein